MGVIQTSTSPWVSKSFAYALSATSSHLFVRGFEDNAKLSFSERLSFLIGIHFNSREPHASLGLLNQADQSCS